MSKSQTQTSNKQHTHLHYHDQTCVFIILSPLFGKDTAAAYISLFLFVFFSGAASRLHKIWEEARTRKREERGPSRRDKKEDEERGWPGLIRLLFCVLSFHISSTLSLLFGVEEIPRSFFFCFRQKWGERRTTFVFWEQETEDMRRDVRAALTVFTLMKSACGR